MFKISESQEIEELYQGIRHNNETYFSNLNANSNIFENEKKKNIIVKLNFEDPQDNLVYSELQQDFNEYREKTMLIDF
jgi:hypothetical protein